MKNPELTIALIVGAYLLLSQKSQARTSAGPNNANRTFFMSPAAAQNVGQSKAQGNATTGLFGLLGQTINKVLNTPNTSTAPATPPAGTDYGTTDDCYISNPVNLYSNDGAINSGYLDNQ